MPKQPKVAALYVISDGVYFNDPDVDPWDINRDARKYKGPNPAIAHPPCERWGRYWGGGPMLHGTERQLILGDDGGCFAHSLWAVRIFGGVLEHPEASHAFKFFGLPIPSIKGGWTEPDRYGGRSCCVAQGNYGHRAQKLTWLYAVGVEFPELKWGKTPGRDRLDMGYHSKEERAASSKAKDDKVNPPRLKTIENMSTPRDFANLLKEIALSVRPGRRDFEKK